MSSKTLYRIGGIAAVLYALFDIRDVFYMDVVDDDFGLVTYRLTIVFIVLIAWALYHLYVSTDRRLSLAALISSVAGAAVLLVNSLPHVQFPHAVFMTAWIFNQLVPVLLFGILAYRHPQMGMPRPLGVVAILYALFYAVLWILEDVNFGFIYNLPLILGVTWEIWTGARLLSGRLPESPQPITIWGADKLKSIVATLAALPRPSWKWIAGVTAGLLVVGIAGYLISNRSVEGSKVISAENAEQLALQPQSPSELEEQAEVETQPGVETLAEWQAEGVNGTIEDYFFNADGSLMAINTPGGMYLIDLHADTVTHLLAEQPYQHRLKAISPDGNLLITEDNESERMRDQGEFQQRLYLWDAATQTILQPLDVALDYETEDPYPYLVVIAMEFSADGGRLNALIDVSNSSGDFVRSYVWDMPDGTLLSNQVLEESDLIRELVGTTFMYQHSYDDFAQVRFLPEGDQFVISNRYVDIYSTKSLAIFSFPEGQHVSDVPVGEGDLHVTADGNAFVSLMDVANYDNEYSTWELPTGDPISTLVVEGAGQPGWSSTFDSEFAYAISPSGDLLAGPMFDGGEKVLAILKNDGTTVRELPISGKVLAFSPHEEYIVIHTGPSLMFVDIATGEVSKTIALIQPVGGFAINPLMDMMAISHLDEIEIYSVSSQVRITELSLATEHGEPSMPSISFSADGKYLISHKYDSDSFSEINTIWNTSDWSIFKQNAWEGDNWPEAAPVLFQPLSLMIAPYYGQLAFFDINDPLIDPQMGLAKPSFVLDRTNDIVNVQLSPDQKFLAYYGAYEDVPQFLLFDLSQVTSLSDLETALAEPVLSYPVEWVGEGAVAPIAFSPASDFLAVFDIDFQTYVIDLKTLDIKWKISDHYAPAHLMFSSDGALLFADGPVYHLDGDFSIYDMTDPQQFPDFPLAELPIVGDFIGISQDGELFISVSTDGVFTYWGIP